MTYDEALRQVETIIRTLERGEAISIEEYKQKAAQAKELLDFCQSQLATLDKELKQILS